MVALCELQIKLSLLSWGLGNHTMPRFNIILLVHSVKILHNNVKSLPWLEITEKLENCGNMITFKSGVHKVQNHQQYRQLVTNLSRRNYIRAYY